MVSKNKASGSSSVYNQNNVFNAYGSDVAFLGRLLGLCRAGHPKNREKGVAFWAPSSFDALCLGRSFNELGAHSFDVFESSTPS